jgi:surface protein
MKYMFDGVENFNQPIGSWDTGKVTDMNHMFTASKFNQDIGNWNVEIVKNMQDMFKESGITEDALPTWYR